MKKAIIIGGGIGGLASGIALRAAGWEVRVFERSPDIREVGAGLAIWANGLKALDRLGLGDAVRAISTPNADGHLHTSSGERLMAFSDSKLRDRFGEIGVMVHRADLLNILAEALGPEVVALDSELDSIEEEPPTVTAHFFDGSRESADVLIGADGIHSTVRRILHGARPLRYAGYTAWRCVVEFPYERLNPGESWGRGARFGQAPLCDGRVYVFATANVPAGSRGIGGEKGELHRTFADWHAPIPELIEAMREEDILRNDVYDLPPLNRWGRGRVSLLGDAAHPMTPNLGQGACQAIEDAVVLARWLGDKIDPSEALRGYERERRPRAAGFVAQSYRVGQVGQLSGTIPVWLRNAAARHLLPRLQPRQLEQMMTVRL